MKDVLIDAETLGDWLAKGRDVVVLDARARLQDADAGRSLWRESHVPGARHADMDRELSATPSAEGGRHPLPSHEQFGAQLRAWGITPQCDVVVYDDMGGALAAARAWWMLVWAGHPSVHVLDGGWQAWRNGDYPIESVSPDPSPSDWQPTFNDDLIATIEDVARGDAVLMDARPGERFRGENEPIDPAAGHIPGARSIPAASLVDSRARFLSPAELAKALPQDDNAISYCGSGISACQLILACAVLGRPLPRLFPGSWSAWSSDSSRPVATGA
ncbi:sulfurtransferase [Salinisphaera hydrothermalis]|uniref:Thiosulfate sulfurtransferase n=1 Tax=Salinisphaera hydrothermalis (strain C41B8) TaxID=1304275 RepID=A0A084INC0_SALHC|nr:sulfurtransferase [Salinisphaera hydrothermalis]KEZ78204.1 thiosulfate sulfurtransferase [Salinisphaera hydrothermalis C41B8]